MKRYLSALMIAATFSTAQFATAATQTANFTVTASVGITCTIAVPSSLAFGNYDPLSAAPLNGVTTLQLTCTSGTPASVDLNQGTNPAAGSTVDTPLRRMSDGAGQFLTYGLFQDAAHTQIWGGNTTAQATTGTGALQTFSIYGQMPTSQAVTAANFTDPVVATVTF